MTMSEEDSAPETAGLQRDEPRSLHCTEFYEDDYDKDGEHAEQVWDSQNLSYSSIGSVSALQQIDSLCGNAGLDVPTTVFEAKNSWNKDWRQFYANLISSLILHGWI